MDVGARADLKSDLLKELERIASSCSAFAAIRPSQRRCSKTCSAASMAPSHGLNQVTGKAGAVLTSNEWLMSIRSRISIPGGTCEFDLPAYYAWQQLMRRVAAPTCCNGCRR